MGKSRFSNPVAIALAAVTVFLGTSTPAGAAEFGPFPLSDISQTASWFSELEASPPVLPEVCLLSSDVCDIVTVNVELPEGVWVAQPGGMLVATQPRAQMDDINDFDLYIYYGPNHQPVAKSTSTWSVGAHAAWVENPPTGLYTIVVAPDAMYFPPARYDGFVSFDRGLTVKREELRDDEPYTPTFVAFGLTSPTPAIELLPDLVPAPAKNFHIETGFCEGFPSACSPRPAHQPSCYPEETAGQTRHAGQPEPGPLRCLRFDQDETNVGDGPLELHMYTEKGSEVWQRVYRSDGNVSQTPVGAAEFHTGHGHFHYTSEQGWWGITLHERLPNGQPGEVVPEATFPAKGICPLDQINGRFGQRRHSPQVYNNNDFPKTCMTAHHRDPNDPTFPNEPYIQAGLSVGWTDEYGWPVIDQYIDITNVSDGKYVIVTEQDPGAHLLEKTRANNTAMSCVEISGLTARPCDVPDLQVTSLSAANTKGREGEKVTISATVSNRGDAEAAASSTEILVDGTRLPGGLLSTPPLRAGESATVSLNWDTRGVKGEHTIRATADSGRTVHESVEDNNAREITVVVRGNKVRNASFEQSSDGSSPDSWSSSGSTSYESGGSDGVRSVSTQPGGSWTSEAVAIDPGASYEASVAAAGTGGTLLVQQLAADGSVLSSAAQPFLPTSAFALTSLRLTALAGAVQARIVLLGGLTGKTSFDDVGLFGV